jgi:hypothetical protein
MNINWTEVMVLSKEFCMTPEGYWTSLIILFFLVFFGAIVLGVFKDA